MAMWEITLTFQHKTWGWFTEARTKTGALRNAIKFVKKNIKIRKV